jgi:hypothetical protein
MGEFLDGKAAIVPSSEASMNVRRLRPPMKSCVPVDEAFAHVGDIAVKKKNAQDLIKVRSCTMIDNTDVDWECGMTIDLRGSFNISHVAARHRVKRGEHGRVDNLCSSSRSQLLN